MPVRQSYKKDLLVYDKNQFQTSKTPKAKEKLQFVIQSNVNKKYYLRGQGPEKVRK